MTHDMQPYWLSVAQRYGWRYRLGAPLSVLRGLATQRKARAACRCTECVPINTWSWSN